jgi:hypothetical protein
MGTGTTDSKAKNGPIMWAASIIGVLAGRYAGINLLIPLAGAAIAFYALKSVAPAKKAIWFSAISVQVGHAIWFIVGLAITDQMSAIIWDPIILLLGVSWLFAKPGVAPVVALSVFQLAALAYNSFVFLGTEFDTNANKALFVHIVFRALALGLMAFALYKSRKGLGVPVTSP